MKTTLIINTARFLYIPQSYIFPAPAAQLTNVSKAELRPKITERPIKFQVILPTPTAAIISACTLTLPMKIKFKDSVNILARLFNTAGNIIFINTHLLSFAVSPINITELFVQFISIVSSSLLQNSVFSKSFIIVGENSCYFSNKGFYTLFLFSYNILFF